MQHDGEQQSGSSARDNGELKEFRLQVVVSSDGMSAKARLVAPGDSSPEEGSGGDGAVVAPLPREMGFTPEKLREALAAESVRHGLDSDALEELSGCADRWVVVARGTPVQQGQNGYVEYHFEGDLKPVIYSDQQQEVDFRDRYTIQQVEEGDVMATIHPPVEGTPGMTVAGEQVQPKAVVPVSVRCEPGVDLSADGARVIARSQGRPVYRRGREHLFKVENLYIHAGPVDMRSGNLFFKGDLIVKGDIEEGMKVLADGDLEVTGNAAGAHIKAGGNIRLHKNCIQSHLQAGVIDLFLAELYEPLNALDLRVEEALDASRQLLRALDERGQDVGGRFPALISSLIKVKYSDLDGMVEKILDLQGQVEFNLPEEVTDLTERCRRLFCMHDLELLQDLAAFETLHTRIRQLSLFIQERESTRAGITAGYVQNCSLVSSGDIVINGAGSYQTEFKSGGTVRIERLFRGGVITAAGDVYIGEAGAETVSGIQGVIEISPKNSVYFGKVYSNIAIKIGSHSYNFPSTLHNIRAYWDKEEDSLATQPWKR